MITRKDFFAEMNGASNMYSTFVLINVSADDVIDALNKLEETEDIDLVIGGEEDETDRIRSVIFRAFKTQPEIIYPLTELLNCKGYVDTNWDETHTLCAENGLESNDYRAEWDSYEDWEDGTYDAFVKITDPTGIEFGTGGGIVDKEVMQYYANIVNSH